MGAEGGRTGRSARQLASVVLPDLLDLVGDAVLIVDDTGRVREANRPAHELLGYPPPTLVGCELGELVPREVREAHASWADDFVRRRRGGARMTGRAPVRARRRDGTELAVRVDLARLDPGRGQRRGEGAWTLAVVEAVPAWGDDARYRLLFEHAAEGIVELDPTGTVVAANPAALRMFGAAADELGLLGSRLALVASRWRPDVAPLGQHRGGGAAPGVPVVAAGDAMRHEVELARLDDSAFWGSVTVQAGLTADGAPWGLRVRVVDVSARVAAERELRSSEARFKAVLDHSTSAVVVVAEDRRILYANAPAHDLLPLAAWRWRMDVGRLGQTVHRDDLPVLREAIDRLLHAAETGDDAPDAHRAEFECRLVQPGGRVVRIDAVVVDLRDDPMVQGWFCQATDVTEQRRNERALAYGATHDLLTGLANRSHLEQRLQRLAAESDPGDTLGVVFIDIDHFKFTNESLGHAFGDQVLRVVSARLVRHVSGADLIARFGGDEFVVVWRFPTGEHDEDPAARLAELGDVAERLRQAVAEPMVLDTVSTTVTASIGVATVRAAECDPALLLGDADAALHRAKRRGRDQVARFDVDLRRRVGLRRSTEQALRAGVDRGELALHYQPIVQLADLAPAGREALVRWRPAGGDLLEPQQFLGVAEESGLIVDIGRWVLRQACTDLAMLQAVQPARGGASGTAAEPYVAVNVSPRQLAAGDFTAEVRHALAATGAAPAGLVLEITEHRGLADPDGARAHLVALRADGVRVAIDDFGTGYSSLAQLADMPVDIVKIDRSFVARLPDDPRGAALVQAIVTMGRALGYDVIAEGVETEGQLEVLRAAGCSAGQGWLFGHPCPLEGSPASRC